MIIESDIIDEITKAMEDVPFGNSCFQNKIMTDGHETPERRKRVILLQLNSKLEALQIARFARDRLNIDIEELEDKLSRCRGIERKRLDVDFAEKKWKLQGQEKLIRDAMIEVSEFYKEFKTLPVFTREEFEQKESLYWEKRFGGDAMRQLQCSGTVNPDLLKEMQKIGLDVKVENGKALIIKNDPELLEKK